jgi:hypothetical protein
MEHFVLGMIVALCLCEVRAHYSGFCVIGGMKLTEKAGREHTGNE